MNQIHIHTARFQPATDYVDEHYPGGPVRVRCSSRDLWWCDCCRRKRWAKYVRVQVYYDNIYRSCAPGHGCNKGERCQ